MIRKARIVLGMFFLTAICFWAAYRAGLLQRTRRAATTASPVLTAIPSAPTATVPSAEVQDPPKLADITFPLSVSALDDGDPDTFIALRYDRTHVFFRLGETGDFSLEDPEQEKTFHQLEHPVAEYGGGQPFELEPAVFETVKQHYEPVHIGEQWQLEVTASGRVPVTIQKPIEMSWGCANNSFTAGFIAEITPEFQATFSNVPQQYFLVHKASSAAISSSTQKQSRIGTLSDWPAPELHSKIERFITSYIQEEIAEGDGAWWAHNFKENNDEAWNRFLEDTAAGQGQLTYDLQAFQLSPDSVPHVYVRAIWKTKGDRAFLISRWLRIGTSITVERKEQDGSETMWQVKDAGESVPLDLSSLPIVLNVFDRPDGYGDVLIYSPGYEGFSIVLYHYGKVGLSTTNVSMGDGC